MSNDCYVASSCIANKTKLVFQLTSRPHQSKLDHDKKKGKKNKEEEEEEVIRLDTWPTVLEVRERGRAGKGGEGWGEGREKGVTSDARLKPTTSRSRLQCLRR